MIELSMVQAVFVVIGIALLMCGIASQLLIVGEWIDERQQKAAHNA